MALEGTLADLVNTRSLRWIFVGGKGGVGKTTTSSSLAVTLAGKRESVLILSTDPAHNLGDAFSQKFSNEPTLVNGFNNLYAMEIEISASNPFANKTGMSDDFMSLIPELVATFPGVDEALSFAELMNSIRTMNYSVIVFDTAPTGHTLRMMGFPQLLEKFLAKIGSFRDKMTGALNMMSALTKDAISTEELNNKFDSLQSLTSSVKLTLQDPTKTTFVCVCIPEFLSVYETERLVQQLANQEIDTSNIVVNQVIFPIEEAEDTADLAEVCEVETASLTTPKEYKLKELLDKAQKKISRLESHFMARRKMQSKYLQQIEDLYSEDFHVVPMPLLDEEVRGETNIRKFAKLLLESRPLPIVPT